MLLIYGGLNLGWGDWVRLLRVTGFEVEDYVEVYAPAGATTRYPWASAEWARDWIRLRSELGLGSEAGDAVERGSVVGGYEVVAHVGHSRGTSVASSICHLVSR